MRRHGIFITLEGIDGTGKSTQFRRLAAYLRRRGYRVRATREPGGTRVGEQARSILLSSGTHRLAPLAELALIYAARAQHLEEVVRPALARGDLVVSDRFNDASFAYQGYGRQLGVEIVAALDRLVCGTTQPDLTLLFDAEPRVALARAQGREAQHNSRHGRFEAQGLAFHRRVRRGYLEIARRHPKRVRVVDASRPAAEVHTQVREYVDQFLEQRASAGRGRKAAV